MTAWQILYLIGPTACMTLVMALLRHLREQKHQRMRMRDWEAQHRLWRAVADQQARRMQQELVQHLPVGRSGVGLRTASNGIRQMARAGLGDPTCSHWPRDPVVLSTGEQVAFICRKCGVAETDEAWVSRA